MSWSSRFPSWATSRFSPFSSRGDTSTLSQPTEISDSDFSYITTEDLAAHSSKQTPPTPTRDPKSPHDTDVLILKNQKTSYPVHFPAHSVDRGELIVGDLRKAAAKRLKVSELRIKLFWKGQCLKDDKKLARDVGLSSDKESVILVVASDKDVLPTPTPTPRPQSRSRGESESSTEASETVDGHELEDEDDTGEHGAGEGSHRRRRRVRHRNKKKGKKPAAATQDSQDSARESATNSAAASTPSLAEKQGPMAKLEALASHFHIKLVPDAIQFMGSPPSDPTKRNYEYKRLTETIMIQVMLKLDAVETEGDPDARVKRKELVKEVQGMLTKLDETMK